MPVKLFNQGKRVIKGHAVDPRDGKKKPYVFMPKAALEFDDETARKLKKIYGAEVLSVDDVKSQFDSSMQAADSKQPDPQTAPGIPAAAQAPADPLAGLSAQERELVLALRANDAPQEQAPQPGQEVKPNPLDFIDVTEEEGKAALLAIQVVRAKNATAVDNNPQKTKAVESLVERLKSLLSFRAPDEQDGA